MKRKIILGLILLFLCQRLAWGEEKVGPKPPLTFIELWNTVAYYDTNLEKKGFASLLGRYEGKVGLNVLDFPLQIYGVYYGVSSQNTDYFDNSIFSGAGLRFRPFDKLRTTGWYNEWLKDVKIFVESLSASYQKNVASAEGLSKTDLRAGIDLWHEWNLDNPDEKLPWGELWMNWSYRDTNFGWDPNGFKNYVFRFQPKIGRYLGTGIEIYLRSDLTLSGKEGPDYYFLNVADYGFGLRLEPWRNTSNLNDLLRKLKIYVEVLGVSYLRDKPTDTTKQVPSDVRFGVDCSYGR